MNKKQLLLLLPISCLLMACNSKGKTSLISGGDKQNLEDEKVVEKLEKKLEQSAETLADRMNSVRLEASIKKTTYDIEYEAKASGQEMKIDASLKDLSGSFIVQVENLYGSLANAGAYVGIKDFSYSMEESMTMNGDSQKMSLSSNPFSVSAYKQNNYAYFDYSDKEFANLLSTIGDLAGMDVMSTLTSFTGGTAKGKIDLTKLVRPEVYNAPIVTKTTIMPYIAEGIDEFLKFAKDSKYEGITFVEFDNNDYAVQMDVMKLLSGALGNLEKTSTLGLMIPTEDEADIQMAIVFNSDYSPKSIELSASVDMNKTIGADGVDAKLKVKGEVEMSASIAYNQSISYPSFDGYQEVVIG